MRDPVRYAITLFSYFGWFRGMARTKNDVGLSLSATNIFLPLFAVAAVLLTIGTAWTHAFWRGTDLSWKEVGLFHRILTTLDLGGENNVGAWFSSMLLLSIAAMAVICFAADRGNVSNWLRRGWLLAAFIFTGLSFTELGSIHERLPAYISRTFNLGLLGWAVWLGPVIISIPVFMSIFAWRRLRKIPAAFYLTLAGIISISSVPLHEILEVKILPAILGEEWRRPVLHLVLEEGTELAGMMFFLAAFSVAAHRLAEASGSESPAVWFRISSSPWPFLGIIIISALALALPAAWLEEILPPDRHSGTPTTWPPSAMAFIVGMTAFFLIGTNRALFDQAALFAIGLAGIIISLLSAIVIFENFGHAKQISAGLILFSTVLLGVTYRRSLLLLGVLLAAAYVIHLSPKWDDGYYLLVSGMLLAWALFLHQRVSTAKASPMPDQSLYGVKQTHISS